MGYKNKKISLSNKLIVSLVSLILLTVISIGVIINVALKEEFANYVDSNNKKEIINIVNTIALEYKHNNFNKENINAIGKDAINKGIIVDVYDYNNNLVWGANEYDEELCHNTMNGIKNNMNHVYRKWSEEYTVEKFNLTDKNGINVGYINIGSYGTLYYMDEEVEFLNEINQIIIFIAILIMIGTIIIAIFISNNISKPIEKVSMMTKLIGDGDLNNKINYESDIKEIDTLINSINNLELKLKEQEKLRKRLTTDISHELRTPLTNIQTHLEAIIDGVWEPTNDRLNSVNEEVTRITSLVNQLKDLTKFDSEKNKLNLSNIKLEKLIKNIIYNFQGIALEKNISISSDIDDIVVYLDKEKISQLIVNLLSNSIRYTNENGNIHVKIYKDNDNTKIHVKDNGIGIPENDLNYIFERFYRVDESRSKKTGGIGVGLTIAKSIVDLHNGKIEVKSKLNEGSEFIVTIPKLSL